jgi:hypothetical protein
MKKENQNVARLVTIQSYVRTIIYINTIKYMSVHINTISIIYTHLGVRSRVVKVVDFKQPAPHRCCFESRQGLWGPRPVNVAFALLIFILVFSLSCEVAIQLANGMSVVILRCPLVSEIIHGRAPEVFLHHTVSVWRKTWTKQTKYT